MWSVERGIAVGKKAAFEKTLLFPAVLIWMVDYLQRSIHFTERTYNKQTSFPLFSRKLSQKAKQQNVVPIAITVSERLSFLAKQQTSPLIKR